MGKSTQKSATTRFHVSTLHVLSNMMKMPFLLRRIIQKCVSGDAELSLHPNKLQNYVYTRSNSHANIVTSVCEYFYSYSDIAFLIKETCAVWVRGVSRKFHDCPMKLDHNK